MPIAPIPHKITCVKCQIAAAKAQFRIIVDGGLIACEKYQKELQKKHEEKKKWLYWVF